jgi:hypothetical protein
VPQGGHKEGKVRWSEKKEKTKKKGKGTFVGQNQGPSFDVFENLFFFPFPTLHDL